MDQITLALAKKYTDDQVIEAGSVTPNIVDDKIAAAVKGNVATTGSEPELKSIKIGNAKYQIPEVEVPKKLSDLEGDSLHRTVTDEQIARWNGGKQSKPLTQVLFESTRAADSASASPRVNAIDGGWCLTEEDDMLIRISTNQNYDYTFYNHVTKETDTFSGLGEYKIHGKVKVSINGNSWTNIIAIEPCCVNGINYEADDYILRSINWTNGFTLVIGPYKEEEEE